MSEPIAVRDDRASAQYILEVDGAEAIAAYRLEGPVLAFTHTEVPPALRGRGIATRLIAGALEDVRSKGLRVIPLCAFVAEYMRSHPDMQDLLVERD